VSAPDFLSGESGIVTGPRAIARALAEDANADLRLLATGLQTELRAAAHELPARNVLVVGVDRGEPGSIMPGALRELERSRHDVSTAIQNGTADRGKFENLNALLSGRHAAAHDWLVVIDDDVHLPRLFLDGLLAAAEALDLALVQPAHRARSHAAWSVTRRRPGVIARETGFVEIGPVTALRRDTFSTLLPFPALRFGWGLDLHWAALAQRGPWKLGVVDAVAIAHRSRPIASAYGHEDAVAEAAAFLRSRDYVPAVQANRTIATYRELPS
jgi:hypothetical protein